MSSGNESMGLNYRRRVVYQALQDTFPDPVEVRRYFDQWLRDHSHEAHFVVTRFAAAVAKAANFDAERRSLFQRRLFHCLTQPYESLPRVPDAWLSTAPAAPVAPTPPAAPEAPIHVPVGPERMVFAAFALPIVAAVLAKADREPGVLAAAVADLTAGGNAREQGLNRQFAQWSLQRFAPDAQPSLRAPEDLRFLAHLLYLLAADLIGPMQADRLLAQATAEAERRPEAAQFSPQLLL